MPSTCNILVPPRGRTLRCDRGPGEGSPHPRDGVCQGSILADRGREEKLLMHVHVCTVLKACCFPTSVSLCSLVHCQGRCAVGMLLLPVASSHIIRVRVERERQCPVCPHLDLRAELRLVATMVYILEQVRLRSHFVVDRLGSRLHPRYVVFQLDRLQQRLGQCVEQQSFGAVEAHTPGQMELQLQRTDWLLLDKRRTFDSNDNSKRDDRMRVLDTRIHSVHEK